MNDNDNHTNNGNRNHPTSDSGVQDGDENIEVAAEEPIKVTVRTLPLSEFSTWKLMSDMDQLVSEVHPEEEETNPKPLTVFDEHYRAIFGDTDNR